MKYVIIGGEPVSTSEYVAGIYCYFPSLTIDGKWIFCQWGKLRNATIFDSLEEARAVMEHSPDWVMSCQSRIVSIHPLNIRKNNGIDV